ncbi:MAG: FAD-binding oxidoreductase [Acidobacteriota bacterium]|nr:FAD-binding oxidoreductase [Acidobacteriota bacterium]
MKHISQDTLIAQLRAVVTREQVLCEPEELLVYECDGLTQHKFPPRAVVFPRTTEEVAAVIRVLARERVPFAPRGAGTGLSGGALAVNHGVVIELARMRRLLKVDVENRLAVVETGMVNAQLSRAVLPYGLYYVPDPSSQATCTIGGNIAENAGGIHCLKYGMTVDHVTAARVVLSNGEIIELGNTGGARAGGYDLLGLFVGSEGTFGIATEATVRLTPIPPAVRTLLADFTDVDDASRAVSAIIAEGLIPAALEMVDGATIRAVEASVFAAGLPLDAEAALLVELDGLEAGLDDEAARCEKICRANGARGVRHAKDEHERKKLWAARKGAFGAMGRISPDLMLQDAVVPRSRLPEVLAATYRIAAKYNLRIANVFHAGDGNLHPFICFDARDHDEVLRVKEAGREMMETCVQAGGTITGEHGVGMDKSDYLPMIFSEDDLDAMRRVRAAFDPLGICNPGKIIPAPRGCGEARAVAMQTEARARLNKTGLMDDSNGHQNVSPNSAPLHETTEASLAAAECLSTDRERERQPGRDVRIDDEVRAPSPTIHRSPFKVDAASQSCARIVGAAHVSGLRSASDTIIVAPASAEEACEVLRLASSEGWSVVPAGGRTWLDMNGTDGTRRGGDVVITTERLTQIIEHEPADLVATAQAGVTLADFNRVTADAGQWLPLDPPDDGRATIGGVAACGLGGAQSLGYGPPRGHVLGMRVALADGRVIKAGGRVVKNVAGYDMCKLFVGSRGSLGVILELTLKLRPRPAREACVVARAADYESLLTAARAVIASELLPVAVELLSPRMAAAVGVTGDEHEHALLIRFAGAERTVDYQIARVHQLCDVPSTHVEAIDNDAHLWKNLAALPLNQKSFLTWRASIRPSELGTILNKIHIGENGLRRGTALWQVGIGDGRLRVIECDETKLAESISFIKNLSSTIKESGGSLIVENAPSAIKEAFDASGAGGGTAELMQRIKHQLDPQNLFSPDA